jgi:hypothetical protein
MSNLPTTSVKPSLSIAKRLGACAVIAAIAFVLGVMLSNGTQDPDSFGFLGLGLGLIGFPAAVLCGALAFVLRRTFAAEVLNGITFFIAVLLLAITHIR